LFIPPHLRHRVERTGIEPACIWLAVFVGRQVMEDIHGPNT
jgi:hypothetical protein